jgi:hypothetical protein
MIRSLASRTVAGLLAAIVAARVVTAWRSRGPKPLPSLYDVHPGALRAPRRPVGVRSIPLDRIVGTLRHPSQNTADFLPLPRLRGPNWRARWQRLRAATDRLDMLPPIDVVQVGEDYWVSDGHNRVAAARRAGAVEIDADTTQLLIPGLDVPERGWTDTSAIVGGEELRQAAAGRHSRTVEQRTSADSTRRDDLLRGPTDAP